MLKRIFWLALAAAAGWLIWMRVRQQDGFATSAPQFEPRPLGQSPATMLGPARAEPAETAGESPAAAAPAAAPSGIGAPEAAAPAATEAPTRAEESPREAAAPIDSAKENERATAEATNAAPPEEARPLDAEIVGYCMRCKTKRPIKDAHEETTESGRPAARGTCPICGANMFTFLKDDTE
jgi:hypothetical protein